MILTISNLYLYLAANVVIPDSRDPVVLNLYRPEILVSLAGHIVIEEIGRVPGGDTITGVSSVLGGAGLQKSAHN